MRRLLCATNGLHVVEPARAGKTSVRSNAIDPSRPTCLFPVDRPKK